MPSICSEFIFFGTRAYFSTRVLDCLYASDQQPALIVIPEFPGYRESAEKYLQIAQLNDISPLEKIACSHNTPCIYSPYDRSDKMPGKLSEVDFDFILVACWPYLLSREIYQLANKAALNLHPSLLPLYRGANPVQEQIDKNEQNLGVSLHLLDDGYDTGDIVSQAGFELEQSQYRQNNIEDMAAKLGVKLYIEAVGQFDIQGWNIIEQ